MFDYEIKGHKTRTVVSATTLNAPAQFTDYEKDAYAEIEKYFKIFPIGMKKNGGGGGICHQTPHQAPMILLFLDEEHRKAFLEYYPESIKSLEDEIMDSVNRTVNRKNNIARRREAQSVVLSNEYLRQADLERIALAVKEHEIALSKCYPKALQIVEEEISAATAKTPKRIAEENRERLSKIEFIKKLAAVLSNDKRRNAYLGKMVYDIGRTYANYGITNVDLTAYTELDSANSKMGIRSFKSEMFRVKLHIGTDGRLSKLPCDFDLTPIYVAKLEEMKAKAKSI